MVDTRVSELKRDQDAIQMVVTSLVDRMEVITTQVREMHEEIGRKWEGLQVQLASMGSGVQKRGEDDGSKGRTVVQANELLPRTMVDQTAMPLNRGNPLPKLEFPDFDEKNLEDWIYRSERYFELEQTGESNKVRLASIYMYGKALQWHYTYVRNRGSTSVLSWVEYVEALTKRFGKAVFDDPMGKLKNLRQEGSSDNLYVYMEEFDLCLRKVLERIDMPEEFQVSLFINGLKEEYRRTLWLLKPTSLLDVQTNARLMSSDVPPEQTKEGIGVPSGGSRGFQRSLIHYPHTRPLVGRELPVKNSGINGQTQRHNEGRGQVTGTWHIHSTGFRRRLSQEEVNERRNKNLCFGCNEPYSRDHRCARRQLYSMMVETVEEEDGEGIETNHSVEVEEGEPTVTLYAINGEAGVSTVQTMRIIGRFKKRIIHILIDSGSTHNFLDANVAKSLGLLICAIEPITIMVANGRKLQSTKAVKGFRWESQGQCFIADFYIIPLRGCEMVMGVRWLSQLGDVIWNFQTLSMKFEWSGKIITLQGVDDRKEEGLLKVGNSKKLQGNYLKQLITLCWVQSIEGEHKALLQLVGSNKGEVPDIRKLLDDIRTSISTVTRDRSRILIEDSVADRCPRNHTWQQFEKSDG